MKTRKAIQQMSLLAILAASFGILGAQLPPPAPAAANTTEAVITTVEFLGSRRVPQDTLRALVSTRKGERYDADTIRRDAATLMATGRYDDIRVEREVRPDGLVVRFVVAERQMERPPATVDIAQILEKFKQRSQ